MDVLLDYLLSKYNKVDGDLSSLLDAQNFVKGSLSFEGESFVNFTSSDILSGTIVQLSMKVLLYINAKPIPGDDRISKLLKGSAISKEQKKPYIIWTVQGGEPHLTLRVPSIDSTIVSLEGLQGNELEQARIHNLESERKEKTLVEMIQFVLNMLNVKKQNCNIYYDSDLGSDVLFHQNLQRVCDSLAIAAKSPQGLYPGDSHKLHDNLKLNVVEIMALAHNLAIKSSFIRSLPKPKVQQGSKEDKSNFIRYNFASLFEILVQKLGLKNPGESYAHHLVLSTIKVLLKPNNKFFPGGFSHSLKNTMKVKSTEATLIRIGYCYNIPSSSKIEEVMRNDLSTKVVDDKVQQHTLIKTSSSKKKRNNLLVVKAAVKLVLPLIDPSSEVAFEKQVQVEPSSVRVSSVQNFYKQEAVKRLCDTMNVSYAKLIAAKSPKSKVTPSGFKASKENMGKIARSVTYQDRNGVQYKDLAELPKNVLSWAYKTYCYQVKQQKSKPTPGEETHMEEGSESSSSSDEEGEDVDMVEPESTVKTLTRSNSVRGKRGRGRPRGLGRGK
jgi:hypothetical protein